MVHPVTGKTISSYKKLVNNPATAEIRQTAFRKDFGVMAQGGNNIGQKGMNAMCVMNHEDIKRVSKQATNSLTQTRRSTTLHKKKTQTEFESQQVVT